MREDDEFTICPQEEEEKEKLRGHFFKAKVSLNWKQNTCEEMGLNTEHVIDLKIVSRDGD